MLTMVWGGQNSTPSLNKLRISYGGSSKLSTTIKMAISTSRN